MKFWQRTIAAIATVALLFNGLIAPLSVLAQEETPSPTPVVTTEPTTTPEATIDASATPSVAPEASPTEIALPTPEVIVTPTPEESNQPINQLTSQPVPTQSPESTPTVQGPPDSASLTASPAAQPTETPAITEENGHLSALILKDTKVDTSSIDEYDVTYRTDGSATIATDKLDYAPTDTAIITGVGFTAEKTYTINVTSTDKPAVYFSDSTKANDKGEIFYSYTLDGKYRPNYKVEIKDVERVVATATFTDATVASISEDNFSIIVIPDTQNYTGSDASNLFDDQTSFIADNKDTLNVAYVAHEGDVVNSSSDTAAYTRAQTAMNTVKGASIPFGIVRGNHDDNSTTFNNYFGTSYHTYDGVYESGKNDNGYSLLTAKGVDYVIVNLSYNPSSAVLTWADGILSTYSTRKAIVVSHSILNSSGVFTAEGTNIFNALSDKPNLFLMLCGHMHDGDGEAMKEDTGTNGNKIVTLLADYQDRGNGLLRLMEFTADNKVNVKTYAVATSAYETDADSQFTLDFGGGSSTPTPSTTPSSAWKAYNDSYVGTGEPSTNISTIKMSEASSANGLERYSDGTTISGVTFDVSVSDVTSQSTNSSYGGETNSGTDAYNTFHGIAQLIGGEKFNSGSSYVYLTFKGLDPTKTYTFATTANRNDSDYTARKTKFLMTDVTSAINGSTSGVTKSTTNFTDDGTTFVTGYNYDNGYVARWTGINPGSDGDFQVQVTNASDNPTTNQSSGPSVFMLQEEISGSGTPTPTPTPTPTSNCSTVNLVASEDTYMSSYNDDYNYGSVNLFKVTNNNNGNKRGGLVKWDVSSIPTNATVSNANLTLNVSTSSNKTYNLYNMRRSWIEGTLTTGATSTNSANWNTYDGSNSWGTTGAANTSSDRYDTNLWGAGTTSFSSTGSKTVALNTNGLDVVQGWISGTITNYGLTIQNYSTTSGSDDLQISSSENSTVANRPTLNVTYCVPTGTPTPVPTTTPTPTPSSTPSPTPTPISSNVSLITTADTYMNSGNSKGNYNYGGATTIQLNPYYKSGGTDQYRAPLLKWDLSSIPSNATINSASLTFYVTTGETAYSYNLYNLRRDWIEGTKDGEAGTGASWNYYGAGTGGWGTVGAANTSSDRYNTNLWNATASDFGTTGNKTFDLNSDGVATLQGWITTPANNFGLTIQNYSGTSTGSWIAASRENTSGYTKPTLNITYTVPPVQQTLSVSDDSHGTVTLNPAGGTYDNGTTVTLTPVANTGYVFDSWTGTNASDVVNTGGIYTIVMNGNKSVTATFKTKPNTDPTAVGDIVTTAEDTAIDIDVLGNDSDSDGDTLSISSITSGVSHGTATIESGKIHYVPAANYFGSDSLIYQISDGRGGFASAAVNISVTSVNDRPVANGENYYVNDNTTLTVSDQDGVLVNDSDVEESPLNAVLSTGTTHGSLTLNSDGSFTYKSVANFNGNDSFTYYANDGTDNSANVGIVTINVSDKTAPVITITNPNTNPAQSKIITATSSDGTLTMSVTTGSVCDSSLTFVSYSSQTFTSESDNGKKVCYKATDTYSNTSYLMSSAISGIDTTLPFVVSVDSDGDIYTLATVSPHAIKVTFSENISNVPTIGVNPPTPEPQTVNNCGDADAKTFCFNFVLTAQEVEHRIYISGAQDVAGNTMSADNSHTFVVDRIAPTATFSYDIETPTNTDVVATLLPSEPLAVTNNGGSFQHTFTSNGTFTYNLIDMYDNVGTATATVGNIDKTAPVIASHSNMIVNSDPGYWGAVVNYTLPTATDNVDSSVSVSCSPMSGTYLSVGEHTVYCDATDTVGNQALQTWFKVTVNDIEAPVITLTGDNPQTIEVGSAYSELGATVTDNDSSSITLHIDASSVITSVIGSYSVTYDATDAAGNHAIQVTRTVYVVDTTKPVIAAHADVTVETTDPTGTIVTYTNPAVSDNYDTEISVTCDPTSGTFFAFGDTVITCNAMDSSENRADSTSFTVHVIEPVAPGITDVCTNIDGIQTGVPDGMHINATGHECVNYMLGGAPISSGNGGVVLGIGTTTPLASWFETEYSGASSNNDGKVLGTETGSEATPASTFNPTTNSPRIGVIDWILTHKKISLGVIIVLIVISYLLFKKKKS